MSQGHDGILTIFTSYISENLTASLLVLQGMDVHDCSKSSKKRPLEPGMVITVEPGVYIPHGKTGVCKSWWGLGCRIEDDVLITDNGVEVLSRGCPKTVDELNELIM